MLTLAPGSAYPNRRSASISCSASRFNPYQVAADKRRKAGLDPSRSRCERGVPQVLTHSTPTRVRRLVLPPTLRLDFRFMSVSLLAIEA